MSAFKSKKVLLLGITGLLGRYLAEELSIHFTIYSPQPRSGLAIEPPHNVVWLSESIDISSYRSIETLLAVCRPDVIINCIAITEYPSMVADPEETIKANSLFPHILAKVGSHYGSKIIHFSTDGVFSGNRGNYSECDLPDPVDLYGRSKLLGEVIGENCMTIRTTFYGLTSKNKGLLAWLISQDGQIVNGYKNYIFSGLSMLTLARAVMRVIKKPVFPCGLYHLGGKSISKYDFLMLAVKKFELNVTVQPVLDPVINRSLDSTRFWKLIDEDVPSTAKMIDEMQLFHSHRC